MPYTRQQEERIRNSVMEYYERHKFGPRRQTWAGLCDEILDYIEVDVRFEVLRQWATGFVQKGRKEPSPALLGPAATGQDGSPSGRHLLALLRLQPGYNIGGLLQQGASELTGRRGRAEAEQAEAGAALGLVLRRSRHRRAGVFPGKYQIVTFFVAILIPFDVIWFNCIE